MSVGVAVDKRFNKERKDVQRYGKRELPRLAYPLTPMLQ